MENLKYLTVPENWKTARIPTEALQAVKLCQIYYIEEEDKLQTELKILPHSHAPYQTM